MNGLHSSQELPLLKWQLSRAGRRGLEGSEGAADSQGTRPQGTARSQLSEPFTLQVESTQALSQEAILEFELSAIAWL